MELEEFDLNSLLEQGTVQRSEAAEPAPTAIPSFPGLVFEDEPVSPVADPDDDDDKEAEDNFPYNAEEAAENLVAVLSSLNYFITPLAVWKLKKKRGGKTAIEKMQVIYAKSLGKDAEKITEQERQQLHMYQAYLKDKEELENAMPFTEKETDELTKLAIPYCRANRIKVPKGAGFWGAYGAMQFQRVMAIIQA